MLLYFATFAICQHPLVKRQYREYQMPVYYQGNKSDYSFIRLYLASVQNICRHKQVHYKVIGLLVNMYPIRPAPQSGCSLLISVVIS